MSTVALGLVPMFVLVQAMPVSVQPVVAPSVTVWRPSSVSGKGNALEASCSLAVP